MSYRLTVSIAFSLLSICTNAQTTEETDKEEVIEKGTTIVGSYFNFSTTNTTANRVNRVDTDTKVTNLGVNLTIGKLVSHNWALMLNFGFTGDDSNTPVTFGGNTYNVKDNHHTYFIAPSVRYYKVITEGTFLFMQGTVLLGRGTLDKSEFDGSGALIDYSLKTRTASVGISPGLAFFMGKRFTTEIAIGLLGYSVLKGDDDKGNKVSSDTFSFLFYQNSVSLGFMYYF